MLSIEINLIDGVKMKTIGHIQIVNLADHEDRPDFGNYRYMIQNEDGSVDEGQVRNFERSLGAMALINQVLWSAGYDGTP